MKFAFLIMGNDFDDKTDRAEIHGGMSQIVGVKNIDAAVKVARELQEKGVDCIELCGAFGEEGDRKIVEATGNKIPVGHITHLKMQDEVYAKFFGK